LHIPADVSQLSLQQSPSTTQESPGCPPDAPPQVLSHVPHDPEQQSLSCAQVEPSCDPEVPPQVPSHVPHVAPLQQSLLLAHPWPLDAQPHVLFTHWPLQQSVSVEQVSPSCPPDAPPHVPSQLPKSSAPQQSLLLWQLSPSLPHGFAHMPPVHTRTPQQSLESVHVSPDPRQPHVPLPLHTLGAQQSLLLVHAVPEPAHPQVDVVVSQLRAPQQSRLPVQPSPLDAHPHVLLTQSAEQQSEAVEHDVPSDEHPPVVPVPPSSPELGS
jgi:hypothetical protein